MYSLIAFKCSNGHKNLKIVKTYQKTTICSYCGVSVRLNNKIHKRILMRGDNINELRKGYVYYSKSFL